MTTKILSSERTVISTFGEVFPDGKRFEIVADPAGSAALRLLQSVGGSSNVGSEFEHNGHTYRPAQLNRRLLRAIRLPTQQGRQFKVAKLFAKISNVLREKLGLPTDDADRIALFCLSSWFPDALPVVPSLWIFCANAYFGVQVLRLVACFCRRPLLLGAAARAAWSSIADLRPTLLLVDAGGISGIRAGLEGSNYQGLLSLDGRGLQTFCFSKAVFSPPNAISSFSLDGGIIHVSLADAPQTVRLTDQELKTIADEFQNPLLTCRVTTWDKVQRSVFDVPDFTFPTRATAAALGACVDGDAALESRVIELLRWQDDAACAERSISLQPALVEVLLGLGHKASETNTDRSSYVSVSEITDLLNTLVRSRGSNQVCSPEEVGRLMKQLGVPKGRNAAGMKITFSDETSRRVHSLARLYNVSTLETSGSKCQECQGAQKRASV